MKSLTSLLLVEDEAIARDMLTRGLIRLGYQVTAVKDGSEAVPLLMKNWDVIVTDLVMPQMDGMTLLEHVNKLSPTSLRVVITSFADKDKVVAVLNKGSDYLLEKPFSVDRLAGILERLLADRKESGNGVVQFFKRRLLGLPLTPRERDLVAGMLKGQANKELASTYGLSEQTVKNTMSGIYSKLGVQSRTELFHLIFPI
jgi:DNA-binding NarL/FixJ family response regulator